MPTSSCFGSTPDAPCESMSRRTPGAILQPQPPPWLNWVSRIFDSGAFMGCSLADGVRRSAPDCASRPAWILARRANVRQDVVAGSTAAASCLARAPRPFLAPPARSTPGTRPRSRRRRRCRTCCLGRPVRKREDERVDAEQDPADSACARTQDCRNHRPRTWFPRRCRAPRRRACCARRAHRSRR